MGQGRKRGLKLRIVGSRPMLGRCSRPMRMEPLKVSTARRGDHGVTKLVTVIGCICEVSGKQQGLYDWLFQINETIRLGDWERWRPCA